MCQVFSIEEIQMIDDFDRRTPDGAAFAFCVCHLAAGTFGHFHGSDCIQCRIILISSSQNEGHRCRN